MGHFDKALHKCKRLAAILLGLGCFGFPFTLPQWGAAWAAEEDTSAPPPARKFNDVLEDLLNEFSYELRTSTVPNLKNISIRRVALSENIPKTYESFLESLVSERMRVHSKFKVIQCTGCRVKKSIVENGRIVITTPVNNTAELDAFSQQLGIETWFDVALLYQESQMVLAFNAFDAKSKELLWSKVYNSESLYKKKVGAGGDPNAPTTPGAPGEAGSRPEEEPGYKSTYTGEITVGYYLVPNVKKSGNMVGLGFRLAERFGQGRSEIGAQLTPVVDPGLFITNYSGVEGDPSQSAEVKVTDGTSETIKPFKYALGIAATYNYNFFTTPENYDEMRFGTGLSLGGLFGSGYITFVGRWCGNLRMGKHFILTGGLSYSAATTLKIKDIYEYKTPGGVGADASFGFAF